MQCQTCSDMACIKFLKTDLVGLAFDNTQQRINNLTCYALVFFFLQFTIFLRFYEPFGVWVDHNKLNASWHTRIVVMLSRKPTAEFMQLISSFNIQEVWITGLDKNALFCCQMKDALIPKPRCKILIMIMYWYIFILWTCTSPTFKPGFILGFFNQICFEMYVFVRLYCSKQMRLQHGSFLKKPSIKCGLAMSQDRYTNNSDFWQIYLIQIILTSIVCELWWLLIP